MRDALDAADHLRSQSSNEVVIENEEITDRESASASQSLPNISLLVADQLCQGHDTIDQSSYLFSQFDGKIVFNLSLRDINRIPQLRVGRYDALYSRFVLIHILANLLSDEQNGDKTKCHTLIPLIPNRGNCFVKI